MNIPSGIILNQSKGITGRANDKVNQTNILKI